MKGKRKSIVDETRARFEAYLGKKKKRFGYQTKKRTMKNLHGFAHGNVSEALR